jgi:DNA-binding NtrC family response regulator
MTRSQLPVVLVDDERDLLAATGWLLSSHGIAPDTPVRDGRELLPLLARQRVGMILLDLFMPGIGGLELLPQVVEEHPEMPVVVMTAAQDADTAVSCMRDGAFDYLVKPAQESRLVSAVRRALEVRSLREQLGTLRSSLLSRRLHDPDAFTEIVTANRGMEAVFQYIEAISSKYRRCAGAATTSRCCSSTSSTRPPSPWAGRRQVRPRS